MFREVNEQIRSLSPAATALELICECSDQAYREFVTVSTLRYDEVRLFPTRFLVAFGHEESAVERVVETAREFVVIEKTGPGALIAIELDPRRAKSAP